MVPDFGGGEYTPAFNLKGSAEDINITTNDVSSGNSKLICLKTGDAAAGDSGAIKLETGSASGTRGQIQFIDGTEGTPGDVWTSTDAFGNGEWAPAPGAAGANVFLSNLVSPTSINQDLIPGSTSTFNIGSIADHWARIRTNFIQNRVAEFYETVAPLATQIGQIDTTPFGSGFGTLHFNFSTTAVSKNIGIRTLDNSVADASASSDIVMLTGTKINGTGGTGFIGIATGTPGNTVGASGQIFIITGLRSGGSGATGSLEFRSGEHNAGGGSGVTGDVNIRSGNNAGSAVSGDANFSSGNQTGSNNSGDVNIFSGNSSSNDSGNVNLTTGTAGGTRGRIEMTASAIDHNQTISEAVVWENGATGSRPGSPVLGQRFFDTTIGLPIWYDGTNWIDAAGNTV